MSDDAALVAATRGGKGLCRLKKGGAIKLAYQYGAAISARLFSPAFSTGSGL